MIQKLILALTHQCLEISFKNGTKFPIASSKIYVLGIICGIELGLTKVGFANKCLINSLQSKVMKVEKSLSFKPKSLKVKKQTIEELK